MNKIVKIMMHKTQHYNPKKYWQMREFVVNPNKKNMLKKIIYLYRIKKSDAFNCASMGTHLYYGATFLSPPRLPHHLNGITLSHNAKIGRNCTIFHQVTIGQGKGNGAPIIGDNVMIGAGAKIIGEVRIGNNVNVGANAVVTKNVPDNKTVVGVNKIL